MKKSTLAKMVLAALILAPSAFAYESGDILVRAGLTTVAPNDDSRNVNVDALGGTVGLGVEVDTNTQIGLNLVSLFNSHLGVEVLAAPPFNHDDTLIATADT